MNVNYKHRTILQKPVDGEFEDTTETVIPKEAEVRVVANRNAECRYYLLGIEQCRDKMLKIAGDEKHQFHQYGFLPCKRLVDAHYRCLTEDKYGYSLEDVPEVGKEDAEEFMKCTFQQLAPVGYCRRYFDESLRKIFRMPDTQLSDV